jgi:hypothetical protein
MSFGFRLHELIDSRIALFKIAEARQPQSVQTKRDDYLRVMRTFGDYSAVNDGGILDGWFLSFRYNYALEPEDAIYKGPFQVVSGFSMFLFGAFLGISNGTMLGVIVHGRRRFTKQKAKVGALYMACFWISAGMLALTHLIFWYGGQHPNWLQLVLVGVGCSTAYLFAKAPVPEKQRAATGTRTPSASKT